MLKNIFALFLVSISLGSLSAQTFIGKINPFPESFNSVLADDTLRILGVMVNFQEDRDGATFGNGKFGSIYSPNQNYGNTILDPLPHDKSYFESHLEFVSNYFSKVSRGKVQIEYSVLPDTFSVSQTMRNYSPEPNSDDFTRTANFSKEAWTIAASKYPDINFNDYDIYIIFHAGVGRDVSLPGSIGNERDLPSLYLSDPALKEILNNDLTGLPVNRNGKYNSMIIPETESREVESLGGIILFQLSINGLLVASVASHLGLPDLFNTETGYSAIGRFGLMDGQAIFAYSGTFPPEPSAWEKIYLGWETPVTVEPGQFNINLVTKNAAALSDTVILKVPINSSEYYLVENRIRDANANGAVVNYIVGSERRTKTFIKDTTGFESFAVDSLAGVVVDIDEFDWAIPNAKSVDNDLYNPIPGGGIIIWHIDEKVIREKFSENKINVDKENRGVDVEEADGIQDIGESFFTVFGDEIVGEGFVEDFWHSGNPAVFYENRFSKDTKPNTNTNSGANSLITFSNFSSIGNRMNFNLSYGDSLIKPIFSKQINLPQNTNNFLNVLQANDNPSFNIISGSDLYVINFEGSITDTVFNFSAYKSASLFWNNTKYIVGAKDSSLNLFTDIGGVKNTFRINTAEQITTAPVIVLNAEQYHVLIGTSTGKVITCLITASPGEPIQLIETEQRAASPVIKIAADGTYYSLITAYTWHDNLGNNFSFIPSGENLNKISDVNHEGNYDLALTKDGSGNYVSVVLFNHVNIYLISNGNLLNNFSYSGGLLKTFSLTDLKKDGMNYIILPLNTVEARSFTGASADNFPFAGQGNDFFDITPLSADFYGDNKPEVIAFSLNGNIFSFDASAKPVEGFPVSAGEMFSSVPALFNENGKISLAVLDTSGNFSAWNIGPTEGTYYWSEQHGNSRNTSFLNAASSENRVNEFFPVGKVYNYPNPVYEGTTFIRYYVAEDAKVNIKIFDLAGGLVEELNDNAIGGFDNETEWNVDNIQSGVYLARVEATGTSGKSENKIIKIAIIK